MQKKWIITIGISLCLLAIVISAIVGFCCPNVNDAILAIIVSNLIVVTIFLTTYLVIDKDKVAKEENKKAIAREMLNLTYFRCEVYLETYTREYIETKVFPNVNLHNNLSDESVINNITKQPFEFDEQLANFAEDGVLTIDDYKNYLELQMLYSNYFIYFIVSSGIGDIKVIEFIREKLHGRIETYKEKHQYDYSEFDTSKYWSVK